jgi:Bacterial regulatory helix-turn-helix protein, lysR family
VNIEAVRAFVAVAEEGQFQHAAGRLGVSQQAVSKRIAALEAELGTALFRRTPSGAALTQDGRTFLPHAGAASTMRSLRAGEIDAGFAYLRDVAGELDPALMRAYAFLEPAHVIAGPGTRSPGRARSGPKTWLPRQARDDLAA